MNVERCTEIEKLQCKCNFFGGHRKLKLIAEIYNKIHTSTLKNKRMYRKYTSKHIYNQRPNQITASIRFTHYLWRSNTCNESNKLKKKHKALSEYLLNQLTVSKKITLT